MYIHDIHGERGREREREGERGWEREREITMQTLHILHTHTCMAI